MARIRESARQPSLRAGGQGPGRWRSGTGRISDFVVSVIGHGGLEFEDDMPDSLAEAMATMEAGLARWFEDRGPRLVSRPGAANHLAPSASHSTYPSHLRTGWAGCFPKRTSA